jgi:hypothetical protein
MLGGGKWADRIASPLYRCRSPRAVSRKGALVQCYCCDREVKSARKVKLRVWRDFDPRVAGADSPAYQAYVEEMTYRWAVVCQACYSTLDNATGLAEIAGKPFNIAAMSRGDKAATIDEAKYRDFRRREAQKLGLDLGKESA